MKRYIINRISGGLLVFFVLSVVVSLTVRLIPGDPIAAFLNPSDPDPNQRAHIESELGLNRPWIVQYGSWMLGILKGNWGQSLSQPRSVGELLGERLPISLTLAVLATLIAALIGVSLGILAGSKPGRLVDWIIRVLSFTAIGIPAFVIGTFIVYMNSVSLHLPIIGYVSPSDDIFGFLVHMLVPAVILAIPTSALLARYARGAVIDCLAQDYVKTALSRGGDSRRIIFKHVLRNALIPVTTMTGLTLANLVGGTVIIESVFAIPGIGSLLISSINASDYPVIQACVMVLGVLYVVINFGIDLLYPVIDPRVRLQR